MSRLFSLMKRWFSGDEPSPTTVSTPVVLSQPEREVVALIDALLDPASNQAALASLQSKGEVAARVIALLLAGRVGRVHAKSEFLLLRMDDLSLQYLWKVEEALVAIGPVAALYVRPLLENRRWPVQFIAAETLGDLKDRDSVAGLLKLLQLEPGRITMAAAEALGKIGDPSAVPHLKKALERANHWDRHAIMQALSKIGGPQVVSDL